MDKKEALKNLKITGWLFIAVGIISLFTTIIYWKLEETIFGFIIEALFRIGLIYFGWLILSSRKVLLKNKKA